ncbi:MAG: Ldh family oxidoreductase [Chloroflexota bacterium]
MIVKSAPELEEYVTRIFNRAGVAPHVSEWVAHCLVDANLAGHDSHGVLRVEQYLGEIQSGKLHPAAEPQVLHETVTTALVDAALGFGQMTARYATELAVAKAKTHQLGAVSVRRNNHIGRVGQWSELGATNGMVTMVTVASSSGPFTAVPYGGATTALGTNPLSVAVPIGGGEVVLLDFATTMVARGKLKVALSKGLPVPEGCIVDKDGHPTTNPADFFDGGALLPFGGHKGYALSVVMALLATSLSAADILPEGETGMRGALFLCINPAGFTSEEDFQRNARRTTDRLLAVPPAQPEGKVLLPGQPEMASRQQRLRDGIPLPETIWEQLCRAAEGRQ